MKRCKLLRSCCYPTPRLFFDICGMPSRALSGSQVDTDEPQTQFFMREYFTLPWCPLGKVALDVAPPLSPASEHDNRSRKGQ